MSSTRKIYRDNVQGLTKPAIQRLAHKAGVKSLQGLMYEEIRYDIKRDIESVMSVAGTSMFTRRARTLSVDDVIRGIESAHGTRATYSKSMSKKAC